MAAGQNPFWRPLPVPGKPKVSVAIAAYRQTDQLVCLLYSFRAQTYDNWEAIVVHDGPGPDTRAVIEQIGDPRIRLLETPERKGQFGHPWRQLGIDACTGSYLGLSNGDNYYAPVYFEWMLHVLVTRDADFAYCDMVHSHHHWAYFPTVPRKSGLDLGAWIGKASLVKATPWRDMSFAGDGTFIEDLLPKARAIIHIPRCLFVHN
jgi:glycosyltransferase involved in cell wall biosynthesis